MSPRLPLSLTRLRRGRLLKWTVALTGALLITAVAVEYFTSGISRFQRYVSVVGWSRIRICTCVPDEDVRFPRNDGLTIAASTYRPDGQGKKPGLVLVHGNTPAGRQLPFYRVLATKLAENGYIVLTIDMTGYGESDDPFRIGELDAIRNEPDVSSAIRYLASLPESDSQRIYAVGHSAGVRPVLAAGIDDPAVKKIVAIGPPTRFKERLLDENDRDYFWRRAKRTRRQVYGSPFPDWFSLDAWLELNFSVDVSRFVPHLSEPTHKPILLINGELESEAEKSSVRDYYERISEPKDHRTIKNSDHYANSRGVWRVILYDKAVVNETVRVIDDWLRQ